MIYETIRQLQQAGRRPGDALWHHRPDHPESPEKTVLLDAAGYMDRNKKPRLAARIREDGLCTPLSSGRFHVSGQIFADEKSELLAYITAGMKAPGSAEAGTIGTLGENMKRIREAKGLSQYALARRIGVSPGAVTRWEQDGRTPKTEHLIKIACALGVAPSMLSPNAGFYETQLYEAYKKKFEKNTA